QRQELFFEAEVRASVAVFDRGCSRGASYAAQARVPVLLGGGRQKDEPATLGKIEAPWETEDRAPVRGFPQGLKPTAISLTWRLKPPPPKEKGGARGRARQCRAPTCRCKDRPLHAEPVGAKARGAKVCFY